MSGMKVCVCGHAVCMCGGATETQQETGGAQPATNIRKYKPYQINTYFHKVMKVTTPIMHSKNQLNKRMSG